MKTNTTRLLVFLTILLITLTFLTACSSRTEPASTVDGDVVGGNEVPAEIDGIISSTDLASLREYYRGGIEREANLNNLATAATLVRTKFFTGIQDLIGNNQFCYKSVAETEAVIAAAVMAEKEGEAIIDALVTASVSGESATGVCAQLNHGIADYTIANRQEMFDTQWH